MAGIELDASAGPLEVVAGLSLELGRMNDRHDEDRRLEMQRRNQLRAQVPMSVRMFSSAVCPTPTAPFGITHGGPQAGFYWILRRIVVGGVTWGTAAAGSKEVYVTALGGGAVGQAQVTGIAAVRPLNSIVDQSNALPDLTTFGTDEIVVHEMENIVAVIVGGTAGQTYSTACLVEVHRRVAIGSEFTA